MKVSIVSPIPWSITHTRDGTYHVLITSGPRESIQLIFPSRVAFGVFADILQSAAASMVQHGKGDRPPSCWESQALKAIRASHPRTAVNPDPDKVTPSSLRFAGFVETPGEGWDFNREPLSQFSLPGRLPKPRAR